MATNESTFKHEIKESFERLRFGTPLKVWSPADKIRAGVSDLHVVHHRFYAIELKWISKMPARQSSNLLQREFTKKQLLFLREISMSIGGVGIGIIGLSPTDAIIVEPDHLDNDGNISREAAEDVYKDPDNQIIKERGHWNVSKVLEFQKRIYFKKPATRAEMMAMP